MKATLKSTLLPMLIGALLTIPGAVGADWNDRQGHDRGNDRHEQRQNNRRADKRINRREDRRVDRKVDRRVDRPVDRKVDRRVNRHIDRKVDRRVNRHIDRKVDRRMNRHIDRKVDRRVNRHIDRKVDRRVNRRIDRKVDRRVNRHIDRKVDRRVNRRIDRRHYNYHGRPWVRYAPRRRAYRNTIIYRPYGHAYYGYGPYYYDDDAWKWLSLTAITLTLLDMIDEEAQREHEAAQIQATTAAIGERIVWQTDTAAGHVVTTREGTSASGLPCREFQHRITVGGKSENAYGTACRQPDGSWKIVQ